MFISRYNHIDINLEFCEPLYQYSNIFPQFLSALLHFPYFPIFSLLYFTKTQLFPIYILQITTQLVTMCGHLVLNPYHFYIPQLSIIVILLWIYTYVDYTTSQLNISYQYYLGLTIEFLMILWIWNLYTAIFINFFLVSLFFYNHTCILDKLYPYQHKYLTTLYILSFTTLALEKYLCSYNNLISWHILFDFLFWQVSSNYSLYLIHNI